MTDLQDCVKQQNCPMINSTRGDDHFDFDLSWPSGIRSDCPHLKINFIVSSIYGRGLTLSSKKAKFLLN